MKSSSRQYRGITDLINVPAVINLDFADVQTVMKEKRHLPHIGISLRQGVMIRLLKPLRWLNGSPLLETTIAGATDVIINVSGDIFHVRRGRCGKPRTAADRDDVNIIFGAMYDDTTPDTCQITVIATGLDDKASEPE